MRGKSFSDFRPFLWLLFILVLFFFLGSIIYLLIISNNAPVELKILDDQSELMGLVDQFARSVTRQDWTGATELFVPGSTVDFHRAFTFLSDYPPLSSVHDLPMETVLVGSWGQQMAVFAGGLSSNHLLIGNCNISISTDLLDASIDCIAIYSYTLAYSMSLYTNNYPTQFVVFQPSFSVIRSSSSSDGVWLFNEAVALINATSTLLNSIETGSAPPGAVITKKRQKRDLSTDWSTLLSQIDTLILGGQIDTAKAVCKTQYYVDLASTFDPYGNDTAFACNTITRIPVVFDSPVTCSAHSYINVTSCFLNDDQNVLSGIATINSIVPFAPTRDFTITGGVGIVVQGNMHGISIHNIGLAVLNLFSPFPFYFTKVLSFISPSITLELNDTAANTVWAGPVSGPDAPPTFRVLTLPDFTSLGLTNGQVLTGVTGNAPVGKTLVGGSNMIITESPGSFTFDVTTDLPPLTNGQLYIGSTGMAPVANQLTAGSLITITPGPGTSTVSSTALGSVTLNMPSAVFDVVSSSGTNTQTLSVTFDNQAANTVFAGPASGAPGVPSFRPLVAADYASMGEITSFMANVATPTTITGISDGSTNMVESVCVTSLSAGAMNFDMIASGRLRYTGSVPVFCHVAITITLSSVSANQRFVLGSAVNGTVQHNSKVMQDTQSSNDRQTVALHSYLSLTTNSYISLYVGNMISISNFELYSLNIFAMCMTV